MEGSLPPLNVANVNRGGVQAQVRETLCPPTPTPSVQSQQDGQGDGEQGASSTPVFLSCHSAMKICWVVH